MRPQNTSPKTPEQANLATFPAKAAPWHSNGGAIFSARSIGAVTWFMSLGLLVGIRLVCLL